MDTRLIIPAYPSSNPIARWVDKRIDNAVRRHLKVSHESGTPVILDRLAMMRRLGIDSDSEFTSARVYGALPREREERKVSGFFSSMQTVPNEWELAAVEAWERGIMERNQRARVTAHIKRTVAENRKRLDGAMRITVTEVS